MASFKVLKIKELDIDVIPPSTKSMYNADQGGSKIVVIGKPGCFTAGTNILMYDGSIKKVEEIVLGDKVMGDDSTARLVLDLCHGYEEMFKIIPDDGGKPYIVNKQHKLVVRKNNKIEEEIKVGEFIKLSKNMRDMYKIYKNGVEFPKIKTKLDPYNFGSIFYNIIKSIPKIYKINSREIRLRLLEGFYSSCGFFYPNRTDKYKLLIKDKNLVEDIVFVARSLGFKTIVDNDNIYYSIIIDESSDSECKFSIDPMGTGEYFGFTVNRNHRFLLNSLDVVRNTGKTTLIASLLYEKRNIFPIGMVMSGTEDSNGYYKKIFPSTFVFNKLNEKKIKDFVTRQKIAKKHLINPWAVLLLDDCTDDPKLFSKPLFHSLYKNGRHWKMWYILSLQYCMDIKPVIRTNIDGTFILREPSLKNRRALWENYAGIIPDFTMFCDIMDQLTDDYTALYIHNATQSNKLEDCMFWYKARAIPKDWKFGSKDFWAFHGKRYDKSYIDPVY